MRVHFAFQFELIRELKADLDRNMKAKSGFEVLFENLLHKNDHGMIASYANSPFYLWVDVTNRLRSPTESKLYPVVLYCTS